MSQAAPLLADEEPTPSRKALQETSGPQDR